VATFLYRLAHGAVRRRRLVVGLWLAALAAVGALMLTAGGKTSDDLAIPGTESQQALDLLEQRFPAQGGSSTQVVFAAPDGTSLDDPAAAAAIEATFADLAKVDGVSSVVAPVAGQTVTQDGTVGFGEVRYPQNADSVDASTVDAVEDALAPARDAGLKAELGGDVVSEAATGHSSELIGLAVAVVVLLLSFGSVLAMGLPLVTALVGLGIGLAGIGAASAVVDLASVAPTLATMIGLAVGIDYALFIVTRHRQNLAEGLDVDEAAARATATAGGAVVFAGATVVIALSGLAVIGIPFLTTMGLAAAGVVAVAVLVAITLLPALLGFVGHGIDRFRVPGLKNRTGGAHEGETFGSRWARRVIDHPVAALTTGLAVMGLLAVPLLSLRLGMPDAGSQPTSSTERRAYDLLADGFGPGFNGPLTVVVDLSPVDSSTDRTAALDTVTSALAADPGILGVASPQLNEAGDTAVVTAIPTTGPATAATESLVHRVRDDVLPPVAEDTGTTVAITGSTAVNIDLADKLGSALPAFMAVVIGLTMLLLTAMFRSVLVPLKAAVAILISIGAAFGVVVAIFQWGWLKDLVGVQETVPIIAFLPMMMFAILFGLSMDYEVFILSRIREEWVHTRRAHTSVLTGLASSARVITAAALIMVSVFASFVLGDDPTIKMFGIGLSAAVLLDATVVRMVIVPATMSLLDKAAWWLPRWLDRLLPNLDVEGERLMRRLHDADAHAGSNDDGALHLPTPATASHREPSLR
jgi:putative drug exporter of the RND superfamily